MVEIATPRFSRGAGGKAGMVFLLLVLGLGLLSACEQVIPMPHPGSNMPASGPLPQQGDTSANPSQYAAFVVTTDYSLTSGFAVIDLDTRKPYLPDPEYAAQVVSPDPAVRAFGRYIFVINRYTYDNISVLDKNYNLVNQYSVAEASCPRPNPHDLAFVSENKAYLSLYECDHLLVLNPVSGERLGTITVPPEMRDSDGIPEMSGLLLHGATLYVALQKLDRLHGWQPTDNSSLMLVDTTVDVVEGEIILTGKNPVTDLVYSPSLDRILVGCAGSYYLLDPAGGIEAVNPHAAVSEGYVIDEFALGGDVGDFVIAGADRGYASITELTTWQSKVFGFDPATGERDSSAVYTVSQGFAAWEIELNDRGELYICDRNPTRPGIAVIDTTAGDQLLTPEPISTWLPPFSLVFLR